jgi:hypothetical protein
MTTPGVSPTAIPHELVFSGGAGWVQAKEALPAFSAIRSFVSGDGLSRVKADYWYSATERRVRGVVTFGPGAEGIPGAVHGGAISGVFDEGVGLFFWHLGTPVVTRKLVVRYRQFIPINSTVELHGHLDFSDGWLMNGRAELRGLNGTLHATMKASFVALESASVKQFALSNTARVSSIECP